MKIIKHLFPAGLIILFPVLNYPQYSSFEFEHISIDQGFYQSTVNCILQDSRGLLWFGTNDGLCRYDGYSFKNFRNISSDPSSISGNNITALAEDNEGNIWIGTYSGFLNIYNPLRNNFRRYKLEFFPLFSPPKNFNENIPPCYSILSYNSVTSIFCDKYEYIWIGTFGSGLFRFDPYDNSLVQYYYSDEPNTISSDYILQITQDSNGTLWAATFTGGLNKITFKIDHVTRKEEDLKFSSYLPDKNSPHAISDSRVTSLEFLEEQLWIGTFGGGLNILNINKNDSAFSSIRSANGKKSTAADLITRIVSDKKGHLWIGTFGSGLHKLDIKSNKLTTFINNPLDRNSIDNNEVISLMADKYGIIWTGTSGGYGVNKLIPERKKFISFKSDPAKKNSLSDNLITAFAEDSEGNIWIGTYKGGLNKFILKKKSFTSYKHDDGKNGISGNFVTCFLADSRDRIWLGTYEAGLNIFDTKKEKFLHYTFDEKNKSGISSSRISSIVRDKNGTIWIGTFNKGINKVSGEVPDLKFAVYRSSTIYPESLPSDNVLKLFVDSNGRLWAYTGGRFLSEFNYDTEEFISFPLDSSGIFPGLEILSMCSADPENLWIGTGGKGLYKFNINSKKFFSPGNTFILKDKSIYGILSDAANNLWLGTNYGIIRYNPADNSTINYNMNDGLQSMKYTGACLMSRKGEMFFGGINGFNCFFPDSVQSEKTIPEMIITSFQVSNKEIPVAGKKILLSPADNSFSIYFTSTDYTDPSKNEYLFMLDGYDEEYKYASGNTHSAEYKDVPSGSYLFKLRGANSGKITLLQIEIPVVFWKSWWFISLSFLIISGFASYFIYYRIRQYLLIEKLKTKLSADLHDSVGSGLTEISLLCEIVQRDYKNELNKSNPNLDLIAEKSRELIDNMSDIVWLVNPKSNTLYDLILRLKDIYTPLTNLSGINLKIDIPDDANDSEIEIEKRQNIYLIFKEGINNSIKYSRAKNILLNVEPADRSLKIILKDDGCGFDIYSAKGNGLINMKRRAANIGANLSIQTAQGKGTTVALDLKR